MRVIAERAFSDYYIVDLVSRTYHQLIHQKEHNPRAHADYAENAFNTYGLEFDIDMELKAKDYAIEHLIEISKGVTI